MLSFDVTELLRNKLRESNRPPDGLLHPSSDLIGPLRHSMLRAAGAPTIESELIGDVRMMTGTMWHTYFEGVLSGKAVMTEVVLDEWLPEGWAGRADWIVWSDEYKAFVLVDLKTIKGEGLKFVGYEGIKVEHQWQASAYWYALKAMGIPLVKKYLVYYLPQNIPSDNPNIEPMMLEGTPINEMQVATNMFNRWKQTSNYLDCVAPFRALHKPDPVHQFVNAALAEEQERVQRIHWVKGTDTFDVKLMPHWTAQFCPFPNELCACSEQGVTKIGMYGTHGHYTPRKGYEDIKPIELTKLQKEKLDG